MNSFMSSLLVGDDTPGTTSTNPFQLIGKYLVDIGLKIRPYAYTIAIIMVIILGIMLMAGGSRAREQVKSHFKIIVIGLIIVIGAPTIAQWFNSQANNSFGNQNVNLTIQPLLDFIKFKF